MPLRACHTVRVDLRDLNDHVVCPNISAVRFHPSLNCRIKRLIGNASEPWRVPIGISLDLSHP
jgi:hypothetical protein